MMDRLPLECDITYSDKRTSSGRIVNGRIQLSISRRLPKAVQKRHAALLEEKLQKRAEKLLALAQHLAEGEVCTQLELENLAREINGRHFGLAFDGISFRKQNSRWGSCSLATRRIYISHRLCKAPRELLAYVVAHELCHVAHPGHGDGFYTLLSRAYPEHRRMRVLLEAWSLASSLQAIK